MREGFLRFALEIGDGRSAEDVADGFIKIAVENMANAIKKISIQRGYDVTRYVLHCFGGAGGQHACLVADALGMTKVLIHPFSSLLSAYGMGLADIRATRQQAVEEPFGDAALASMVAIGNRLGDEARSEVNGQGVPADTISVHVRAHIRYAGTDTALVVPALSMGSQSGAAASHETSGCESTEQVSLAALQTAFEVAHKSRFGFIDPSKALVIEAVSIEAIGGGAEFSEPVFDLASGSPPPPVEQPILLRRRVARRLDLSAASAVARAQVARSGHHHRAAPDRRRRGGMGSSDYRQEPSRDRTRCSAQARERDRDGG